MSYFSAANYPLPPGGSLALTPAERKRADGSRRATAGVVASRGRGSPATAQNIITVQAVTCKNQSKRRMLQVRSSDPRNVFAPASSDESDFDTKKGMLGLCVLEANTTFRGGMTGDTNVEVVTNMAGMSRDVRLGIPCVVQLERSAADANGDDRTTIVIAGVQTLVTTGSEQCSPGQKLYADPNPFMVDDPDNEGQLVSGINISGINKAVKHIQLRPLNSNNLHSMTLSLQNEVRLRLGSAEAGRSISAILGAAEPEKALCAFFTREATQLLDARNLAVDMPVRGLMHIYAAWLFVQLVSASAGTDAPIPALSADLNELAFVKVVALQTLRLALQHTETTFSRCYRAYDSALPQDATSDSARTYTAASNRHSLSSAYLSGLLDNGKYNVGSPSDNMRYAMAAEACLNQHFHYHSQVLRQDMHDYLARFVLGIALSGSSKGKPIDVLVGGR